MMSCTSIVTLRANGRSLLDHKQEKKDGKGETVSTVILPLQLCMCMYYIAEQVSSGASQSASDETRNAMRDAATAAAAV